MWRGRCKSISSREGGRGKRMQQSHRRNVSEHAGYEIASLARELPLRLFTFFHAFLSHIESVQSAHLTNIFAFLSSLLSEFIWRPTKQDRCCNTVAILRAKWKERKRKKVFSTRRGPQCKFFPHLESEEEEEKFCGKVVPCLKWFPR